MQPPTSEVGQAAQDRLRQSPHAALREVECDFAGGTLTLRGRVPSFYYKQLAQEAVAHLEGVVQVSNRIDVLG